MKLTGRLLYGGWSQSDGGSPSLCIVNSCCITERSEKKVIKQARSFRKRFPQAKVVVSGCISDSMRRQMHTLGLSRVLPGEAVAGSGRAAVPAAFAGEYPRYFLKIQNGCANFCSYCVVPYTRKKPVSLPAEDIMAEIEAMDLFPPAEIVISGTDIATYSYNGVTLPDLLKKISGKCGFRIRLSSLSVPFRKGLLKELSSIKNLCPHFALPLQSGSDRILKKMFRKYSVSQFLDTVAEIRSRFEDPAVTTDIMFGFPTETDADFERTLKVIEKADFSRIHVFPFSPRAGTLAGMYKPLPARVMNERKGLMLKSSEKSVSSYAAKFVGKTLEVVTETASDGFFTGTSQNYIKIEFTDGVLEVHPGDIVLVRVHRTDGGTASGRAEKIVWARKRTN